MKSLLMLVLLLSVQGARASEYRDDLTGQEAFILFHKTMKQLATDIQVWIPQSQSQVSKSRSSVAGKACVQTNNPKSCEVAIHELATASVVPIRDRFIYKLAEDLKTKYQFDVQTGLRIFQLNSALRFLAKPEVYNGVPAPKSFNHNTYKSFVADIEGFLEQKNIDLKKALPMIH
ncbi:hypothetical protein [Bdellovibrio sp. HCB337]|uniref:hypothetical protein n=1 Tax=Bdellovibrio sp. HCB337 TaxID=3394358 RepID=UPI0039A4C00C